MFKRIIPLASAALLLFSCGGSNVTNIKLNEMKTIRIGPKAVNLLSSKETGFKKEKKYSFTIKFGDYEFEDGQPVSNANIFVIGNTTGLASKLETYDVLDEESTTISYNGKELTKVTLTAKFDFDAYIEAVEGENPDYDNTYIYMSGDLMNPVTHSTGFIFGLYDMKKEDKIVIKGTSKIEKSSAYAMYVNGGLA